MATSFSMKVLQPLKVWLGVNILTLGLIFSSGFMMWQIAVVETGRITTKELDLLTRSKVNELKKGDYRTVVEGSGVDFPQAFFAIKSARQTFTTGIRNKHSICSTEKLDGGGFTEPVEVTLCRSPETPIFPFVVVLTVYVLVAILTFALIVKTERLAVSNLATFMEGLGLPVDRLLGFSAILARIKDLSLDLENAKQREFETAKDQAISEMASQVVHDIASPLAVLEAVTEDSNPFDEKGLSLAKSAISRIKDITNDLKGSSDVAVKRSQELIPIGHALDSIIAEKKVEFSQEPQLRIHSKMAVDSTTRISKIDAINLKRAISNLVNNAIEASANIVSVEAISISPASIQLVVQDNGKGITTDDLSRIEKQILFSTKSKGQGLGLKQIFRAFGQDGQVLLHSVLGKGTEIKFSVPIA